MGAAAPVATLGETEPSPVTKRVTRSTGKAGLDDVTRFGCPPCRIAPVMPFVVKMPGDTNWMFTVTGLLACPLLFTTSEAERCPASSHGTWKLICSCPLTLSTAKMGACIPYNVIDTPTNCRGRGSPLAKLIPVAFERCVPNSVAIEPGVIPCWKLAPLVTSVELNEGVGGGGGCEGQSCELIVATVTRLLV